MLGKEYFIGKLPPPVGGVTVFNQRKIQQLQDILGNNLIVLEPRIHSLLKIIIAFRSEDIKHISASNIRIIILSLLFCKNKTVLFYDHNSSRHFITMPTWKKFIYLRFLLKCKGIIVVDYHLLNNYKIFKEYDSLKQIVEVISAFLPPLRSESQSILDTYNIKLINIYNECLTDNKRRVVITSASHPSIDSMGNDIYMLEKLIDIFFLLSEKFKDKIFVIAIANYLDTDFSDKIKKKVRFLDGKRYNLVFLENNTKIWPLLEVTQLFIRATTTDGDSVSLKEALYFGAPVLASDVVSRPKNVELFNLYNDNLLHIIERELNKY